MSQGKTFTVRRGQTAVPNRTIYDGFVGLGVTDGVANRLSVQAIGVLVLALSRPDDAPAGYRAYLGRGMGRDALLKALRELGAAGLRWQFKRTTAAGTMVTDTIISESPLTEDEAMAEWTAFVAKLDLAERAAAKEAAKAHAIEQERLALERAQADAREAEAAFRKLAERLGVQADQDAQAAMFDGAPISGARWAGQAVPPCDGLPAHGEPAHVSLGDTQVSKETSSFIDREIQANEKAGAVELPSQGGAGGRDDATMGPGRGAVRDLLAERRNRRELKRKSLRSGLDQEAGA
jgi:hypothetical protein